MSTGAGARDSVSTLIAEVHACQGCGACLLTCPEHAIRPRAAASAAANRTATAAANQSATVAAAHAAALVVHPDRCTGCGECVEVCPVDAIVLVSANPEPTA